MLPPCPCDPPWVMNPWGWGSRCGFSQTVWTWNFQEKKRWTCSIRITVRLDSCTSLGASPPPPAWSFPRLCLSFFFSTWVQLNRLSWVALWHEPECLSQRVTLPLAQHQAMDGWTLITKTSPCSRFAIHCQQIAKLCFQALRFPNAE